MARRTSQVRDARSGQYEKNTRCEDCGTNLGQLDDGQYDLGGDGKFRCFDCAEKEYSLPNSEPCGTANGK